MSNLIVPEDNPTKVNDTSGEQSQLLSTPSTPKLNNKNMVEDVDEALEQLGGAGKH